MTSLALIALLYPAFLLILYVIDRATGFKIADAFGKHVDKTTDEIDPAIWDFLCGHPMSPVVQNIKTGDITTNPLYSDNDFPPQALPFQ